MDFRGKRFHFIAIGGAGMSALAGYLAQHGMEVSGSDIQESKYTRLLKEKGIKISIPHDKELIKPDMIIAASSAIKPDNPEIQRAKELNLEIYHRSDILKMISDEFSQREGSYFIGFSGTHGKTTTSGLCAYVLEKAGLSPSFIVGGIIPEAGTNGHYGKNKYLSAELDESDGTIQKYATDIAVINNLEEDHLDYYKNGFSDLAKTFDLYLANKPNQKVIINNDNGGNREFMKLYSRYNYITFGLENADYTAENIEYRGFGSEFDVCVKGKLTTSIRLIIPGKYNIYNALAVYAALNEAGVGTEIIGKYFSEFTGMGRRFQKVSSFGGIDIFDDYAHHPSEIKAVLSGIAKGKSEEKRLVAIFQPHRYTRLRSLWDNFKQAFGEADKLIILDVYSAGEDKIKDITSENFAKDIKHKDVTYVSGPMEEAARKICTLLKKNDIVITLGAGTVTKIGRLTEQEYKKANTVGINN